MWGESTLDNEHFSKWMAAKLKWGQIKVSIGQTGDSKRFIKLI